MIHLRNLVYEHLQNTWSSWWNCIAWSKSALLLELSWLLYFLLYFAPLAKSLGDKKVPNNENIAKVFGKDTTNQGHECIKTYGQTSLSPSHNMANMYKKTTFGNGCEYQVSRLVVQTKPNRYKVGISDIQSLKLLPAVVELETFISCQQLWQLLSTTLTTFTSCRKL